MQLKEQVVSSELIIAQESQRAEQAEERVQQLLKDLEQEKVKRVELASKTGLAAGGWNFGSLFKGLG